jgi:hypothetical protein
MFKKGQGNVADTIQQLQAGKASSQYPLDGAFIATGNVSFVAGKRAALLMWYCNSLHAWHQCL